MAVAGGAFVEGEPCWADVMLPDPEAGKRFYGGLFGWTFGPPAPPERGSYTIALLEGSRAAALSHKPDGRLPTAWTVYFATPDAAATAARIRAAGGQLVTEPVPIGGAGTMATAVDPGGAAFGLWQPGSLTGFEVVGDPGAYVWTEVCTREKAPVDTFYARVFGYGLRPAGAGGAPTGGLGGTDTTDGTGGPGEAGEAAGEAVGEGVGEVEEVAESAEAETLEEFGAVREGEAPTDTGVAGDDADAVMLWALPGDPVDDEHAVGARTMIDDTYPVEMPAHFLVYFAVADCEASVRAAVRLGGRTVRGPEDSPHGGRHAVLVDDQGARFGVLETPVAG
ncbi:VOC family protein [Streptomyces sp. TRM43335]|uniref:VOC family protein n=1 Tax=Streptomyces taklimakanensis TaxID=2569853 RepID=A0A6G2BB72_9ACTN|nr:VOC family protein [Streptomyces taklimakanensis]MTE19525.1 VOC family protein [Streptomyces taklimakanensis]